MTSLKNVRHIAIRWRLSSSRSRAAGARGADRPTREKQPAMTAAPIPCRWCGRACRPPRGGSPRLFSTSACRTAFLTAARRWAERAIDSGALTIADLRNGDPAACTLLSGGISRGQGIRAASLGRHSGRTHRGSDCQLAARSYDRDASPRELTWGDPFHPATPAELAAATCAAPARDPRCHPWRHRAGETQTASMGRSGAHARGIYEVAT